MPLNVAKQSLIPAFLTLVVITTVALLTATEGSVVADLRPGLTPEVLPIPFWGAWLHNFQVAHPHISGWISGVLMLYTGASLGRLTVRYNLYGTGSCLAIALYGLAMIGTMRSGEYLTAVVTSMLLMLAVKNLCFSYRNGFGFDRIFRGAAYLTLLLLVEPAALPLLLLLPVVSNRFRRTTREMIVATAGLLLPIGALCYLNWALQGEFLAPLQLLYHIFMTGRWCGAPLAATLHEQIFFGVLMLVNLMALGLFGTNSYNVGIKARHILQLSSRMLFLAILTLLIPAASSATLALVVVPATLLMPMLFIRIHQPIARLLYLLLIVASLAFLFL